MVQREELGDGKRIKPIIRHVPYHARRTLGANGGQTELVKSDMSKGLGTVGRTGYIYNDGPGSIEIKIYDGNSWTDWITIATNHGIDIYYEDNIWMEIIKVKADKATGATYELTINPGLEEEVR